MKVVMAEPVRNVFLSAVTKELGSYREGLAHALTRRGFTVKVQENFTATGGTLLKKLDDYIQDCQAVICLVGERYGAEPEDAPAEAFAHVTTERHSYTQWEYLLARHHGRPVYVFVPAPKASRDLDHRNAPEPPDLQALQAAFREHRILAQGIDRTPFETIDGLKVEVLVIPELVPASPGRQIATVLNVVNPYRGLQKFEAENKDYFFGRTSLTAQLLAKVETSALVTVFGNSGSGKSSVIRAGVIPRWKDAHREGKVIVFNPDIDPFAAWRNALGAAGLPHSLTESAGIPSPTAFIDLYETWKAGAHPSDPGFHQPWFIFIDQFEEIFTRAGKGASFVRDFVSSVVQAATSDCKLPSGAPAVRVVLAMRDDFIGDLRDFDALYALTDPNLSRITAPTYEELCEMIELPAALHGVRFEDGLVPRIASQVEGQPGMLPWLQYALQQLWEKERERGGDSPFGARQIHRDSYTAIDGVEGALRQRVTHFYAKKTVDQQRAVRHILLSLIDVRETDDRFTSVSRSATRSRLVEAGGDHGEKLLRALVEDERFLIASTEDGDEQNPVINLAHEALIKGWEEFEKWIGESREAIKLRNELSRSAREWECRIKNRKPRAARDELWQGSRLERAVELERDGEFERIGGLGELERKFVETSQREGKERKIRVSLLRLAVAGTSLVSIVATLATFAAVAERQEAQLQTVEARVQAGRGWMLRAELARERKQEVEAIFYAARAVGFEGLGKAAPIAMDEPDRGKAFPSFFLREARLDMEAAYSRYIRRGRSYLTPPSKDFPSLLGGKEAAKAYHQIAVATARPFVWSSPVASQHSGMVWSVAWSPDGQTLASGSSDKSIKLWDVASGQEKATLAGHSGGVVEVAWSPDGKTLASGSQDRSVKLWDSTTGKEQATLAGHSGSVLSVAWSPDGQTLAGGSWDDTVTLWNPVTGKEKLTLVGHSGRVRRVAWSPDGQSLASGSDDKSIKLWDVASGKATASLAGHSGNVFSVAWSPDGQTLASGSDDESIKLWDVRSGKETASLSGHSGNVFSVAWSPDGQTLASGSDDKSIKLWDVRSGRETATLAGHSNWVTRVAWSPDGQTLASGSDDKSIKLWDVASGREKSTLARHSDGVTMAMWSPDGQTLASGSDDGTIKLWEVASGKEKATLATHSGLVNSVAWSPDGQTLASGSSDNSIQLWEMPSGKEKAALAAHSGPVNSVAWSPDGQTLASGSDDKSIKLWDVTSGRETSTLAGHPGPVNSVAWSPDGHTLASGSDDSTLKLWDVTSGRETSTLAGHPGPVNSVAWSPDGQTLASGSDDSTVKLWDLARGKEKATLAGHSASVKSVAWSPDGQTLASGSADKAIKLWEAIGSVETNLYVYLKEGWCKFDSGTEDLRWNDSTRITYNSSETPYHNVPRWSSLGILRRADLSEGEKNWLHYTKVLQAQNWAALPVYYSRLTAEQKERPHAAVVLAAGTVAEQAGAALKSGSPRLAAMRFITGSNLVAALPEGQREEFYAQFGAAVADTPPCTLPDVLGLVAPSHRAIAFTAVRNEIISEQVVDYAGVKDVQAAIEQAKAWTAEGMSWVDDLPVAKLARLGTRALSSDDWDATSIVSELIPRLEATLPAMEEEAGAGVLRLLAKSRTGVAALGRWRELLSTDFASESDVQSAGALAAEINDGKACREIFQAGISRFPKSFGLLNYQFGTALRTLGADEEALPYFRLARENPLGLNISHSYFGLAKLLDDLGIQEEAWTEFKELAEHPEAEVTHLVSAGYFSSEPDHAHPEECRIIFDRVRAMAKGNEQLEESLRMESWALMNLGEPGKAHERFLAALAAAEQSPSDDVAPSADLWAGLAGSAAASGQAPSDVARFFVRAVSGNPEFASAEGIQKLGWHVPQKEPLRQALAITSDRDLLSALTSELQSQAAAGDEATRSNASEALRGLALLPGGETLDVWKSLLSTGFGTADDYASALRKAVQAGENDAASIWLGEAVERYKDHAGLLRYELGTALRTAKRSADALPLLQQAKEQPVGLNVSDAHWGLAQVLSDVGKQAQAWVVYRELLALPEALDDHVSDAIRFASTDASLTEEVLALPSDPTLRTKRILGLNDIAWELATAPNQAKRNGALAVKLAQAAVEATNRVNADYLDTLAAAFAEAGQFDQAVDCQLKALESAPEASKKDFGTRLESYRKKVPYREKG